VSQPCQILLVNSNTEDQQRYRHDLLADPTLDCTILEESSAQGALQLCELCRPDGILTDLALPDLDGLTFLQKLKLQMASGLPPVVIIADESDTAMAVRAIKSGAEDYLVKAETTTQDLQLAIRTALENARLRQELEDSETERRRIQSQLQQNQHHMQQVAEAVPGMLYIYDLLEQRNVYVNRQVWELLGYTETEVQAMGANLLPQLLHPDDLVPMLVRSEQFQQAADGEIREAEYRMRRSSGEWRWLCCRELVYRRLPDGTVQQILGIAQDITDRKQMELDLAASKERLELAQQASGIGSFDVDLVTGKVLWDRQLEALYGLSGNHCSHVLDWQTYLHPEDRERVEHNRQQIWARRAETWCDEYRILQAHTGELRWIESRGRMFYSPTGQPLRALGTNIDITERKQTELQLQVSQRLVQRITDTSPSLIYLFDLEEQRNLYVNSQSFNLLGFSTLQIQELGDQFMQQRMHPADLARMPAYFATLAKLADGEVREIEYRMRHQNGEWRWFRSQDTVFERRASGLPKQVLGVAQDITDRKRAEQALQESEARFRRLMDCNLVGVMFWHIDGRILDANDTFLQMIGYSRADLEAGQLNWRQLTPPEELELSERSIQRMRQGTSDFIEKFYIRKDGRRVPITLNGIMFEASQESGISFVLDLSERKQAEAERNELLAREQAARSAAEAANYAKDQFLTVVSHELRAPLASILGWVELLQSRSLDPATSSRALEIITRNARWQSQLIEDLLDISRITRGDLKFEFAPVDLVAVVEAAVDVIRPAAAEKQIQVSSRLSPVGLISGDFNRLQQVVWNLLSNAVKFTPSGGSIELQLSRSSGPSPQAELRVQDNGIGIRAEFLPYIFDQFRQFSTAGLGRDGLGLGLAIVRHFVDLHQGTIQAASAGEGQGTTFTLTFPLTSPDPPNQPAHRPVLGSLDWNWNLEPVQVSDSLLQPYRLLLVDDEADNLEVLSIFLQEAGATVATATSGQAALEQFQRFQPDLLISDISMPNMDGCALLGEIRKLERGDLPAIATTAYLGETSLTQIRQAGFQLHLTKPLDFNRLIQAIVRLLNQPSSETG
jgi:PAS domain S-box-containing protein